VDAAGNDVLARVWKTLGVEGRITLSIYGTAVEPEQAAELHVPILEALRAGDVSASGREARRHIEYFARLAMKRRR
jgi:DNA-binding GntR family transcriptional regulator